MLTYCFSIALLAESPALHWGSLNSQKMVCHTGVPIFPEIWGYSWKYRDPVLQEIWSLGNIIAVIIFPRRALYFFLGNIIAARKFDRSRKISSTSTCPERSHFFIEVHPCCTIEYAEKRLALVWNVLLYRPAAYRHTNLKVQISVWQSIIKYCYIQWGILSKVILKLLAKAISSCLL